MNNLKASIEKKLFNTKYSNPLILYYLLLMFSLISSTLQAQLKAPYLISSIGPKGILSSNASSYDFKSVSNCIDVQTGINVFSSKNGTEKFVVNCKVNLDINTLGIKFYPNPVINNAHLKFIAIPILQNIFSLSIFTTTGDLIQIRKETGYTIYQGILLNLNTLSTGTYFIQIESLSTIDIIKFIKK